MIGKIAVSAAIYAIDKPYDYRIPDSMVLQPGQRVQVPFGKGNKRCEGVVLAVEEGYGEELKCVEQVLDKQPLLDERMLRLAAFLRERYFCTFYDAIKTILPAGVWFSAKERYTIAVENWQEEIHRQPVAMAVMQCIADLGGEAEESILRRQFEEEALHKALHYLLGKKLLTGQTERRRGVQDKTERIACLACSPEEALQYAQSKRRSAPLQTAVLELLCNLGECAAKDLRYYTGATGAVLKRLETLGYLRFTEEEVLRIEKVEAAPVTGELHLNEQQQRAYEGLRQQKQGVSLLYGVTGSGKTSVYIKLIYDVLEQGKSAIVLVPEIALTPQLLGLFAAHFGEKAAVLHSGLRITERYDTWKRIRSGEAQVVLGTRSAVFAPVQRLGLLIIDEEQEHTYKSEQSPRYHAREVAMYRGAKEGAPVILGSATPSVETMYRAKSGIYRLYTMSQRYNRKPLPPVEIVDMKQELKSGNATAISEPLLLALRENISKRQQSILFLNRRGSSRMLSCVDCGYVPECPGCTVNLTYHNANGRLMCHYCGHSERAWESCDECGGMMKHVGSGTQKVEEELQELFPGVEVLRMDADTVSGNHEQLLEKFEKKKIPILLGTQMVAKGLDFENVTLVGVLSADLGLYMDNYRAAERTFSLLTQVVGRAGRGSKDGRAVIQTFTPDNEVIASAAAQDYNAFYADEIRMRRARRYPPFADVFTLTISGQEEGAVLRAAVQLKEGMRQALSYPSPSNMQTELLGPAAAPVLKVNNRYRYRLFWVGRNDHATREIIAYYVRAFHQRKENRGMNLFVDCNAVL